MGAGVDVRVVDRAADLLQEVLHAGRRHDRQHADIAAAFVLECVQQVLGNVHEGARTRDRACAICVEGELALENVEGLVLPPVEVGRRSPVGRHQPLEERIGSSRVNTSVLEEVVIAGRPDALSFPWLDNFYLQHWPCSLSNQATARIPTTCRLCGRPIRQPAAGRRRPGYACAEISAMILVGRRGRLSIRVQLRHELVEATGEQDCPPPGQWCPPSGCAYACTTPFGMYRKSPGWASNDLVANLHREHALRSRGRSRAGAEWICRGGPSR